MPEKPPVLSVKQSWRMRRNYVGRSCKLHYEAAPMKMVRGFKQYMYDEAGNEYLDCISNVSHVGHCHPRVAEAGQEQMTRLTTSFGFLSDTQVEYAKRLVELLPENLCICYFLNSGSEANDLALRLAKAYTKNSEMLVIDNSYHGNTENLVEMSPLVLKRHNYPLKDWVHVVPTPDTYRGKYRENSQNPAALYAHDVKKIIKNIQDKGKAVAAFLSEPLCVAAGVLTPPSGYLNCVYRMVREAGGVCIADEIQTGLGRCGDKHFAFQLQDVVPDILTLGKPLGNGYPMGVVITTREISDSLKEFSSTFGGNPVACAMGMSVLDVIRDEQLLSGAKSVGKCLIDGLKAIEPAHSVIGDIRGNGMVVGMEIVENKESRKPNADAAELLVYRLKEQKFLLNNAGPDKNVITFLPPLCFTCENARTVVQTIDKVLGEIEMEKAQLDVPTASDTISVPLSILTGTKRSFVDSSDEEAESPQKRAHVSYEEMD